VVRRNPFIYSVNQRIARLVFSLLYHIEMEREAGFPLEGPAVILPKHQYWTDIPLVSLSFRFPLLFVAKKELFRAPGIGYYLSLLGFNAMKYLVSSLKAAERVVIFPEGTYVRRAVGPGKNRLIQMILGIQSDLKERIPFIPMGIRYGDRVGLRRQVEIKVGSPLFAEGESEAIPLTQRIMEEISRLSQLPSKSR
jgi:1-acyl-sn-glycerol-3-phosphate acyltransferase